MSEQDKHEAEVNKFGAALSEFIARTAHRMAQNPAQPDLPDKDELRAYENVKASIARLTEPSR